MGWLFGRKKSPESAEDMLRRYNEEQAARLAAMAGGAGCVVILRDGVAPMPAEIAAIEMFRKKANEASVGSTVGILFRDRPDVVRGDVIRTTASS